MGGASATCEPGLKAAILTETVVVLRHDIGERVGDIATEDNLLCFPALIHELRNGRYSIYMTLQAGMFATYEQIAKDDAADEDPFPNREVNDDTIIEFRLLALGEDVV